MKKFFIILTFVFLLGGYALYTWLNGIEQKVFIPTVNKTVSASANTIADKLKQHIPFDILLLGYGGGNHDGAYLTDSMMAVHVDPKQKKIFLISIPRDTWVKIPTNGTDGNYWKINAAYTLGMDDTTYPNKQAQFKGPDGGGRLAEYMVSQITGLPISYFVGVDFSGFTHTIDTLGGVTINVEKTFDDYQYPLEGKEDDACGHSDTEIASLSAQIASGSASETDVFPCRYEHLHFDQGTQHMDGTTALKYVRSRHSLQDGTDFGRAQRQRNLLVSVKQKIFSAGFLAQILPFMTSLGDDVRTDISFDDLKALIQQANVLNTYKITTLALTDQNFLQDSTSSDGQAILQSRDGLDNWDSVHNWITDTLDGKSEAVSAVVKIENGTPIAGLAQLAANRVKNQNIQVLEPSHYTEKNVAQTKIILFDKNINQTDIQVLKKEFGVVQVSYKIDAQSAYNVLVVLGEDYNKREGKKLLNEP